MKYKLRLERTRPEHLHDFVLRHKDALEIFRQTLINPVKAVQIIVNDQTAEMWTVLDKQDQTVAIFGVLPGCQLFCDASVFMLTSTLADLYYAEFALRSRKIAQGMIRKYKHLNNIVDATYEECHKWLEFCGFIIDYDNPVIVNGYKFYAFRGDCNV